ncbi:MULTISPECIES: transcription-repair coupling factor [unclassified Francisella]|uniref:transcription-repair coupling factor n=1 Tax=unclassified Francisella TaxID=2610885 RepID=UPI002E33B862|nr:MULTISPECIES: transcription-repair coupling factor [unclassified Francisella]MED7818980.1 transcription-repair coupling factor [Francisella sp. 19S2-4]MED7829863.1 transcription-repair coupling factor [Francisella sp. 19S2-10]
MLNNQISAKDTIVSNAYGSSFSILFNEYLKQNSQFNLIVTEDSQQAHKIYKELRYLNTENSNLEILFFPNLEILPYDRFSAAIDIISRRQEILHKLTQNSRNTLIVTSISNTLRKLAPAKFIKEHSLILKAGQTLDITKQKILLTEAGYTLVNNVFEKGEFSIRGSIIDIFPVGSKIAYRIDLFDDEIDSIKELDTETQRSGKELKSINIMPSHEFIYNNQNMNLALEKLELFCGEKALNSTIATYIENNEYFSGIEFYLPLFYTKLTSIFYYLPNATNIHLVDNINNSIEAFIEEAKFRYNELKHDIDRPILPYQELFYSQKEIKDTYEQFNNTRWFQEAKSKSKTLKVKHLDKVSANYKLANPFRDLQQLLDKSEFKKVIFSTDSNGRAEVLLEHLNKLKLNIQIAKNFDDALKLKDKFCLIVSPFQEGVIIDDKIALITEVDLFPEHIQNTVKISEHDHHPTVDLKDLTDLKPGMHVVHIDHGIGRYEGLESIELNGKKDEFILLLYANDAKIYVPITSLNLISIYNSSLTEKIALNKLGSDKWKKQKEKTIKKIIDVAANLLEIYAKREMRQGFSNSLDEEDYLRFCADFPYEETPDQLLAINDVFKDMISAKPMDRLICGDVGFGKTEIAMRAAYLATQNQKQVAILVPTTILAQQHYNSFKDRFTNTAVNIEVITRSKTAKAQEELFENLKKGSVDIIIGTHKLISSKIDFKNLGLLIIDEEHRFGVAQKEKLKSLKAEIDILTMSATPIPRSLSMAFSALRDLSIIASPPAKRLSVKTFVKEYDTNIIREAVSRETIRGGQIFYLYNKVETIEKKKEILQELFPRLRIAIAHGQMSEKEIQKVMFDFKHNKYHILLCTTIIETGIDIPNANTLIIENANNLGLAQLHQLRGRVGRAHHQAYAYMLIPNEASITKDAIKRLEAIGNTESLGGGFTLANHDLEIRGAGEILGKEQSGNIDGIGLNLYMDLLDKTIANLKAGKKLHIEEVINSTICEVELNIPTLIPDYYIYDVNTRLNIYKRISKADHKDLINIKIELIDRFGRLPLEVTYLLKVAHIKIDAIALGIGQIKMFATSGKISFSDINKFEPQKIIKLLQSQPADFRLTKDQDLLITKATKTAEQRIEFVEIFLRKIA